MATSEDSTISGERSPLLLAASESTAQEDGDVPRGASGATFLQNVLNCAKTCMGTGALALPYSARQGGVVLHFLGVLALAGWNLYSVNLLLNCLELLPRPTQRREKPPNGVSTLGKVAFYALGHSGLHVLDLSFAIWLFGVLVAYMTAIVAFLMPTPLTTGSGDLDALIIAVIIGFFSNVPDMGYLAKLSAMGLSILFFAFVVICSYGKFSGFSLNWWPQNGISGISHWFGCNVFGFGTVPLTYNLRDSMAEPHRMLASSGVAFSVVASSYILIGIGMLLLYPDVDGDILQELPTSGFLPTTVRLAMSLVVLATAPLLVVPCGELIEGKIFHEKATANGRVGVRVGICILSTIISRRAPSFVNVISFVGCCLVGFVGFVVPPLLYLALLLQQSAKKDLPLAGDGKMEASRPLFGWSKNVFWIDIIMLVWGIAATVISTVYTFRVSQ